MCYFRIIFDIVQVGHCWHLIHDHFMVHDCSTFGRTDSQALFIPLERRSNVTEAILADFHSHTGLLENPQTAIIKRYISIIIYLILER